MSKLKALITTLVLGSSSLAAAEHSEPVQMRPSWGDHWSDDLGDARRVRAWIPLGQPVPSGGRDVIQLDERIDDLAQLRLHAASGATYVYSLLIRFDDGSRQRLAVNKWIYAGAPLVQLDLPQHRGGVSRIIVTSWAGRPHAKLQVLGQRLRVTRPQPPPPPPPQPPIYEPAPPTGVVLGANLSFANTNGFRYVPVGAERGRFKALRLEGVAGRTPIAKVRVDFANGHSQTFANLGRVLARGQVLDLTLEAALPVANVLVIMDEGLHPVGPNSGVVQLAAF